MKLLTNPKTYQFIAGSIICFFLADAAIAASAGMPWEGPLDKIIRSMQGPLAFGVGIASLTIAAISWALGAGGSMIRTAGGLGIALSCLFNVGTILSSLFGASKGLLI